MATPTKELKSKGDQLVELVAAITTEDLAAMESRVEALERELAALRQLRQMLRSRLGLADLPGHRKATRPPREPKAEARARAPAGHHGPAPKNGLQVERRKRIAAILAKDGPKRMMDLADATDTPRGTISSVMDTPCFQTLPDGRYHLTPEGRQTLLED